MRKTTILIRMLPVLSVLFCGLPQDTQAAGSGVGKAAVQTTSAVNQQQSKVRGYCR